jgi:GT2 family glycosyltransferase
LRIVELDLGELERLENWPFGREATYLIAWASDDLLGACFVPPVKDARTLARHIAEHLGYDWRARAVASAVGHPELWRMPEPDVAPPAISVVVCATGDTGHLRECLASLRPQLGAGDELLVVTPGASARVLEGRSTEGMRWLQEPRPGRAWARNRAIEEAREEVLAFIDYDAVAEPGWLDALRAAMADPEVDGATGASAAHDAVPMVIWRRYAGGAEFVPLRVHGSIYRKTHRSELAETGPHSTTAWRRSLLRGLGGFDPALTGDTPPRNAHDSDLFRRALMAGATVVHAPDAVARHARPSMQRRLIDFWGDRGGQSAKVVLEEELDRWIAVRGVLGDFAWQSRGVRQELRHLVRRRGNRLPLSGLLAQPGAAAIGALGFARRRDARRAGRESSRRDPSTPYAPPDAAPRLPRVDADLATGRISDPGGESTRPLVLRVGGRPIGLGWIAGPPLDVERLAGDIAPSLAHRLEPWLAHPPTVDDVAAALLRGELPRHPLAPEPRPLRPGELTVVICTDRGPEVCGDLLRETAGVLDVLVMERGDRGARLREICAQVGARHEHNPGRNKAQKLNRAMELVTTPWVLFLDDDCRVGAGGAERLSAEIGGAIDRCPDVGAITGLILPDTLPTRETATFERKASMVRGWLPRRFTGDERTTGMLVQDASAMGVGAAVCVRHEAWRSVGGYDERLGPGTSIPFGEDDRFLAALVLRGWPVFYDPRLDIRHHHGARRRSLVREYFGHGAAQSMRVLLWGIDERQLRWAIAIWRITLRNYWRATRENRRRAASLVGVLWGVVLSARLAGRPRRSPPDLGVPDAPPAVPHTTRT